MRTIALFGALAVALGAFGAHGLKELVGPEQLATFNTGVRYHFYHTLAMAIAFGLAQRTDLRANRLLQARWAWGIGILLFSGSLYLLTLEAQIGIPAKILGPITPIGGVFFIVGWVLLFLSPKTKLSNE
ncbi:MAG: DUF423 domain-containing protein [Bacteroidota bacterium]